jgi:CheY-like chemotaxis protein
MMPGLDGVGLAASVRKLHPKLPLIAITGLINPPGEEDRAARLRELGVQHVLRKPFSAEALLQALDEVLKVG